MLTALRTANLALSFGLARVMLGALAVWGIVTGDTAPSRWVLGLGSPVLAAVIWGIWLAPRSDLRLDMPWLVTAQLVIFAVAAAALYGAGYFGFATSFVLLVMLNVTLATVWNQR